ncbi:acyl-CoA thioesterase/bile acid-CoA:amino acid N-acyltransferase family protein [Caballeronia sp. LZ034LL]|uniref:acyl-CoA thioesterase/bile acid-CoA:amino acid N-acyltransferase family protein n=1 Tax=Caballeronia sp. LZ034LL TaxID=3038567 RepID=UPI00285DA541|nr:acyl-CoA thioesterase/bile acid-CoA:amino acid N-acyltransferase family protein [Caballeronia sp. LZ034LL]MDR5836000.1 acyl-CoA thioesterase/bile acid-CoA:amino acid N-acyltransferase family protein [Caballeronia sp. LZ034LL]
MSARIEVTPRVALVDVTRQIVLTGFAAGAEVDLSAHLTMADGSEWRSDNRFAANEAGRVDLAADAPVSGDYAGHGAQPMGIVWSMRCVKDAPPADAIAPLTVRIDARDQDGNAASASFEQHFVADGVTRRAISEAGVVGTLFLPATPGPHPAIVVLNGSGGGINEPRAALYAAHGYAALALGYFNAPGLPATISRIPLEYFANALDWLRETVAPAGDFVAVAGQSRGGELALQLAATWPARVSAVIGYVPSAVRHGTLRAGAAAEPPDAIAWTLDGRPLPHVWQDNAEADWRAFRDPAKPGEAVRQAPAFETALRDAQAVARARIEVERIRAPILLISGTDDGFWPSTHYAGMIVADLTARGFGHCLEHQRNEGAGHAILFPHVPTTRIARVHPVARVALTAGGTAAANARANEASWARVLAFLAETSGAR